MFSPLPLSASASVPNGTRPRNSYSSTFHVSLRTKYSTLHRRVLLQAIDIWMGACTAFIFAALLEFTLTNYLWRKGKKGHTTSSR